ncbi:hypothetical protein TrLO_g13169 [Triparma laevis f. longispina]|uniref:Uncharacterized protein n=1 Tax=Triparma laevis f. longispina TaxID=1714387 RepID=A0A9W7CEN3_9STRA|nr:hypothetical protein TrLO_g13169 [Triparma laevis f. longispina]
MPLSTLRSTTSSVGSFSESTCNCPSGKFDDLQGTCIKVTDGMSEETPGMNLTTINVKQGFWRTNSKSTDVRECLIPEACVGGNSTNYCRSGHEGPYCAVCATDYFEDPFGLCKTCDTTTLDIILTVDALLTIIVVLCTTYKIRKKLKNRERESRATEEGGSKRFPLPSGSRTV